MPGREIHYVEAVDFFYCFAPSMSELASHVVPSAAVRCARSENSALPLEAVTKICAFHRSPAAVVELSVATSMQSPSSTSSGITTPPLAVMRYDPSSTALIVTLPLGRNGALPVV